VYAYLRNHIRSLLSLLRLYIGAAGYSLIDVRGEPTGSFFSTKSVKKKKSRRKVESIHAAELPPDVITGNDVVLLAIAHPDDETVLHGELTRRAVAAGAEVHEAFATVGEASSLNYRFWRPGFVAKGKRWLEVQRAARRMGVQPENLHDLGFADGEVEGQVEPLAERLGALMLAKNVTKVATTGPKGYDKHPDHIAVDTAVLQAVKKLREEHQRDITVFRLNSEGEGQLRLAVDRDKKIWATIAHFCQFPGVRLFGRNWLPRRTKRYLAHYEALLENETYDIDFAGETSPDAYRNHSVNV
jgi:LmbE family N-acetylglucosaminyl deacetylase